MHPPLRPTLDLRPPFLPWTYEFPSYLGLSGDLLKRLYRVLNAAARTIFNLRRRDPISQHLKSLGWLPITLYLTQSDGENDDGILIIAVY